MGTDCQTLFKASSEVYLDKIVAALTNNYVALFTCALILVAAMGMSAMLVSMAQTSVQNYRALLPAPAKQKTHETKKRTASGLHDDDMVYPGEAAAADQLASNLQDSDNSRIRASIAKLKGKYSAYNLAMTQFAGRVQGREADDLMDERILDRSQDDFVYGAGR